MGDHRRVPAQSVEWAHNPGGDPNERCTPMHFQHAIYYAFLSVYSHASPLASGKRVLDAGCGVGFGTHYLAVNGACEVVGVDIAPEAIEYAVGHYQNENLRYALADCVALPFWDDTFDLVFCSNVIEHVEDYMKLIDEVLRVLVAGGVFFLATPPVATHGESPHPHHVTNLTPWEWETTLKSCLSSVEFFKLHTRYKNWFKESLRPWEILLLQCLQPFSQKVRDFVFRKIFNPCHVRESDFLMRPEEPENLAGSDTVCVIMVCRK